jgi:integrase
MARKEALRLSAEYDAGNDPAVDKKKLRNLLTWADLFTWYIENHAKPHKRTWEYDVSMEEHYCKVWRARPYTAIDTGMVTRWHKQIGRDNGKHQADRVLAMVKTVFAVAIDAAVIQGVNPAAHVHKFFASAREYSRERFLSAVELGRLLRTLGEYHDADMSDFFMVALFTGARRSNVQSMRWDDMDRTDQANPKWTIPGTESKNKAPMSVPLLPPVLAILNRRYDDQQPGKYVFPAKKCNSKTGHLTEPKKSWATICAKAGLKDVRIHDLRRTMGSWQSLLGASMQVIGRSLGHKSMQSTEVYARLNDDPVRASMGKAITAMLITAEEKNDEQAEQLATSAGKIVDGGPTEKGNA